MLPVALGDRQRQLPRQQVVPGIPIGDLHDFAAVAQFLDVCTKNDFHCRLA
jgi:hypothetical protein